MIANISSYNFYIDCTHSLHRLGSFVSTYSYSKRSHNRQRLSNALLHIHTIIMELYRFPSILFLIPFDLTNIVMSKIYKRSKISLEIPFYTLFDILVT